MKSKFWLSVFGTAILLAIPLGVVGVESSDVIRESSVVESSTIESTEATTESSVQENLDSSTEVESKESESSQKEETETTTEEKPEESVEIEDISQYVSLNKSIVTLFRDLELTEKETRELISGQTFLAKEKITDKEGTVYYSLYDKEDILIGYIDETQVTLANTPGGAYQSFNQYVTVTKPQGQLLSNFEGKVKGDVSSINKETFIAKGKYIHFDGTMYFSIFDAKDNWKGYINEKNVSIAGKNKQGVHQGISQYASIKSKNYTIWQNFNWTKKYDSSKFYQRNFRINGEYHHFNGDVYYSLYDNDGRWYGYLNKNAMATNEQAQGEYISLGKYVTVKDGDGSIWNSFNWNERYSRKELAGQTFLAKGVYYHANGSDYYSLYDKNNKWYGYINKNFVSVAQGRQGSYQTFNKYVTVTSGNYDMWQNFDWKQKSTTSKLKNKTYQARGLYRHFNGSTYYSLFDNKGVWYGYLNANATEIGDGAQGIYQHYGKAVTVSKANYPIWRSFSWDQKDTTNAYLNKKVNARGKYEHFNGSTYYSLYDTNGKWIGYLNKNATAQDAEKMAEVQKLLNRKYALPNYGIYVMSLEDGSVASMNANKQFTAASTGKLPAMYYTQKMINEKKIDPNRLYLYTDAINQMPIYSYMRGGAGILQGKPFGTYYSLDTMLNWTAKYSDNQGANFLGYYGANQYELKMRNEISRIIGRQWISPFQVSAKENALLIAEMNKQGGQVMGYMQNTVFDNQRIPKYLPVKVAHKIGDVGSFTHDIAVVYTDRPYVLSVMTQYGSYESISVLSKEIYDIMK